MLRISLAATALLALLAWTAPARASDPVPASSAVDAPTYTLELAGQEDDTSLVHFYRRFGFRRSCYYSPYRYSYSYYRPYYSYSYYRPYYSYYRPYYGYSYSYSYYPSYYYQPYYYGYSYYTPSYSYWGPSYYYGGCGYISADADDVVAAVPLGDLPCVPLLPDCIVLQQTVTPDTAAKTPVMPKAPADEGKKDSSYRYDGGPQKPVPQPNGQTKPETPSAPSTAPPKRTVPLKGYLVSLPEQPAEASADVSYRAYGSEFAAPQQNATPAPAQTSGFAYRAYGEQSQPSGFATQR